MWLQVNDSMGQAFQANLLRGPGSTDVHPNYKILLLIHQLLTAPYGVRPKGLTGIINNNHKSRSNDIP